MRLKSLVYSAAEEATQRGIVIVNISQCSTGMVEWHAMKPDSTCLMPVLSAVMIATVESVLTKLMFLLGHGLSPREVRNEMSRSIAGEFTRPEL